MEHISSDLERLLILISRNVERRAVSLRQLSFLFVHVFGRSKWAHAAHTGKGKGKGKATQGKGKRRFV